MFGDAFQYIDYTDCEIDPNICDDAGVKSFPTWIINGELEIGDKSAEDLSELADC